MGRYILIGAYGRQACNMHDKEGMRKKSIVLCPILLCCLLLAGCSLPDTEQSPENVQKDLIQTEEEPSGENAEERVASPTDEEILAQLLESGSWHHMWWEAGISEEDTEEAILQKLEQWESLEFHNRRQIKDLECLRLWPNLQSLVIDYDAVMIDFPIHDFSPIAGLTQLKELYISYPSGEELDLSFLAQMDTLRELSLDCSLKDLSFLENMPQLERLSLCQTSIPDLTMLLKLPNLVELTLCGGYESEHMEALGKLSKLQRLTLQDCGIQDISFLAGLTELCCVNLNYNSVTDLTPLSELSRLEQLELKGNEISDLSALEQLSHLNRVDLSQNQIQDFSPLADKPELLSLSISGNPCTDLEPVLSVPFLHFEGGNLLREMREAVSDWMKESGWMEEQHPEMAEYFWLDYSEADLDGDGLVDVAIVVNGEYRGDDGVSTLDDFRSMLIFLQKKDGSWEEVEQDIYIPGFIYGGTRGDPYWGIYMGEGYVLVKTGTGSGTGGTTETCIYRYRQGSLELEQSIVINDSAQGYDVTVHNKEDGTCDRYSIVYEEVMGNCRYVKVDLNDSCEQ